jgi:hypothetical protein
MFNFLMIPSKIMGTVMLWLSVYPYNQHLNYSTFELTLRYSGFLVSVYKTFILCH